MEEFRAVVDILTSFTPIVAVVIAYIGMNTWRKELKGRTEYDIAFQLMKRAYMLAEVINNSRAPIQEMELVNDPSLSKHEQDVLMYQRLYNRLLQPISDAWVELRTTTLNARVIWGSEISLLIDELYYCARDYRVALELDLEDKKFNGEIFAYELEERRNNKRILYRDGNEGNEMTMRINTAISAIEDFIRPKLEK